MKKVNGKQSMKQSELARALGVSEALITKHKKQGMPVHLGVEACRAWRASRVRLYVRPTVTAAQAGVDLEQLRARLAAMSDAELAEVRLPEATWDALTGWGPTQ